MESVAPTSAAAARVDPMLRLRVLDERYLELQSNFAIGCFAIAYSPFYEQSRNLHFMQSIQFYECA